MWKYRICILIFLNIISRTDSQFTIFNRRHSPIKWPCMSWSYLSQDTSGQLYDMTNQYLKSENQTSIRYLVEWFLVQLLYRFPHLQPKLWQDLHVVSCLYFSFYLDYRQRSVAICFIHETITLEHSKDPFMLVSANVGGQKLTLFQLSQRCHLTSADDQLK